MNRIRLTSLAPRRFFLSPAGWAGLLTGAGLTAAAACGLVWSIRHLPAVPAPGLLDPDVPDPASRKTGRMGLPMEGWAVFRMEGEAVRAVSDSLANRFRLAGTFRVTQPDSIVQKGVLSDRVHSNQTLIVAAGDSLDDGILVKEVKADRVELVRQDVSLTLVLEDAEDGAGTNAAGMTAGESADLFAGYAVLDRGRFGIRTEDTRWLFERRKVLEYYNEVLEDADRLVALFDSLKPLYDDKKKINGYILIAEGEQEFFKEVGLKEGDVLRKVNSAPLMNRRVAEGFIRDFGQNDLNVAVLEIERAGEPVKLVYELR